MPIFLLSLGDFALRILARSSRADFSSFDRTNYKRDFVFFRIVWHRDSARMHAGGFGGEVSYPIARKCSPLDSMFLKYRL